MPKKIMISQKRAALVELVKRVLSFIKQLLKADQRLSIISGFLAGKRIWMRPMFPRDREVLEDCFTDPKHMQYFGEGKVWPPRLIESTFEKCSQKNILESHISTWSIISHDGLTGCFWLTRKSNDDRHMDKKIKQETAEIGYCSRPSLSGRGYTTEAGKLIIDAVAPEFEGLIFATVHPKNKGSQRVLEKMGLEPDPNQQNIMLEKYRAPRNFYLLPSRM